MKLKSIMFAISILITQYCFSQQKFPRSILLDNDTVIVLLPVQLKAANVLFVNLDFYKDLADTLRTYNKRIRYALETQWDLNSSLSEQLDSRSLIIGKQNDIILNLKKIDDKQLKQIRWVKTQRSVLAFVCVATLAKIFVFK